MLYRGIFACTDSNYTNVLINDKDELLSIDENSIGKTKRIIHRNTTSYTKEEVYDVLNDIMNMYALKLGRIKYILKKYGMKDKYYDLIKYRFKNFPHLVLTECDEKMNWFTYNPLK